MKNRSVLREIIVKILYQIYIYEKGNIDYDINNVIKENIDYDNEFVTSSVNNIIENKNDIDNLANKYLKDWTIDRLSMVDHAIISLAIYELKYTKVPGIVCINEAVLLSKKYSDEKVTKMINAMLDSIYNNEALNE